MKLNLTFLLIMLVIGFVACDSDPEDPMVNCETTGLTYNDDIAAIFNESCALAGCHNEGNAGFSTYEMFNYATTKAAVDDGRIIGSINHESGFLEMPRSADKLDDCTIDKITQWIEDGAPEM